MAKDISANVELEGGSIEVTPSLSDLTLAADANIHNVGAVKVQSDWNEIDDTSASYVRNKPNIASGTGTGSTVENSISGNTANEASGACSHAEGVGTKATANNAHAEGSGTTASGGFSHAEGIFTVAAGTDAHAEGVLCQANGNSGHAEGNRTIVDGNSGHAEGRETKASADYTHSEGYGTVATSKAQHVQGQYNVLDTEGDLSTQGKYAHIVGNGTADDNRSNAHTLDWDGNAWFAGKVTADGTPTNDNDLVSKKWVEDKGYLTQHQDISSKADKSELPTKVSDLSNDSDFISGLTELVYGTSTWAEFTAAYNAKKIVYCRCPMSGSSYRYAFLAYVSNTTAEFQYYRSVSTHTASQMGDQVFVYTLSSKGTWTTTTREASPKIIAGTGLQSSYTKDKLTLSIKSDYPTKAEVSAMIAEALAAYENGNTNSY